MSWFSSKPEPANASSPTSNTPTTGPGAEQERYATHFSIGKEGLNQAKEGLDHLRDATSDAAHKAVNYKGDGAEQDRYGAHFTHQSPDNHVVRQTALSILAAKAKGEEPSWPISYGLGADGWERAQRLAFVKGTGAEQVCIFPI